MCCHTLHRGLAGEAMRVAAEIILSEKESRRLEQWAARSTSTPVRMRERTRIVLMAVGGMINKEISAGLGTDTNRSGSGPHATRSSGEEWAQRDDDARLQSPRHHHVVCGDEHHHRRGDRQDLPQVLASQRNAPIPVLVNPSVRIGSQVARVVDITRIRCCGSHM